MWNNDGESCGTITYSGQTYETTIIGSQCWMTENLNIGTMISGTMDQSDNDIIEKYCYDNSNANCDTYGGLYQWAEIVIYKNGATNTTSWNPVPTANVQGICPDGWHIPTNDEWTTLTDYLGGTSIAGEKMKSTSGWNNNGNRTNSVGFNGLPGGYRLFDDGSFSYLGDYGRWWSSTEGSSSGAWRRGLYYGSAVR